MKTCKRTQCEFRIYTFNLLFANVTRTLTDADENA